MSMVQRAFIDHRISSMIVVLDLLLVFGSFPVVVWSPSHYFANKSVHILYTYIESPWPPGMEQRFSSSTSGSSARSGDVCILGSYSEWTLARDTIRLSTDDENGLSTVEVGKEVRRIGGLSQLPVSFLFFNKLWHVMSFGLYASAPSPYNRTEMT